MRGLVQTIGRGVFAAAVVVMLAAAPVQAQENDGGGSVMERGRQIVKIIRKLTVRVFGDVLIDPRP
ncbi:MAG: hypothetical protein M3Q69_01955 [Acidobacteriota bacterium]|nr:hypothetical protein [Acidobacteriota bacterium]